MFARIRPRYVPDQIVDQILSAIFEGNLHPGTRLPSDRALAAAFGVGRQAVREAISKLQAMGLVTTHRPKGTFVQLPSAEVLHKPLLRALEQEISGVENFLNVRKWLEGMTAAEAAEHATDDDLEEIEACWAKLEVAAEQSDREALDAADIAFHLAVVRATHNPLAMNILDTFQNLMWSSHGIRTVILEAVDFRSVSKEHGAVAAAIRARAPERARDAMIQHIEKIRFRVRRLQEQTRTAAGMDAVG